MTKFYNNSKLVKETKHIFPEKVNLDAYHDLKTSNWHFYLQKKRYMIEGQEYTKTNL